MPAETTENAETATAQHPEKRKEQQQPETTYYEGILYHGAPRAFQFRVDYRFDDPQADGSATLGLGLYTSDEADVAVNYSEVRSGRDNPPMFTLFVRQMQNFLIFEVKQEIMSR